MEARPPKEPIRISAREMILIVIVAINLAITAGVARWTWLTLDEQIELRKDFMRLQGDQAQLNTQFEFWLGKLGEYRKDQIEAQKEE